MTRPLRHAIRPHKTRRARAIALRPIQKLDQARQRPLRQHRVRTQQQHPLPRRQRDPLIYARRVTPICRIAHQARTLSSWIATV